MPTYPTYKLGEICIIERGGSPRPIKDYLTKDDNGLNWIKIGDATLSNKYIYTTAEKIKPEGLSKTRMVESGDLILSNSMSFGRPYIMRTSGCIHDGWVVFRLNKEIIDEEYLYNILNSNEVYAQFAHLATGSTVKNLNVDRVKEVRIPLPPLATQRAIVSRIETLFAELDKGVEKLKTAQQQLKVYRQAVLNDCLTKGSEKWEIVKLGEVAEMCLGKMLDKNKNKGNYQPYLRNVNVRWGSFDLSDLLEMRFEDSEQERYGLQNGDLIMCEGGEPGRCAIWNGEAQNMKIQKALHRIRLKPFVSNKYVYYLFYHYAQNGLLEKYFTGTTIKHLTGQSLKSIEIYLPSLPIQQRIVQEIETRLSACDEVEKNIAESLQQAEALRQSILKKAFSGELASVPVVDIDIKK